MPDPTPSAFISYSRVDSDFAHRLARDLKAAGARVWLDRLDIIPGQNWDNAIEDALDRSPLMILILSPSSAKSDNVRNEISYALEAGKTILPVLHQDCVVPLRLQRTQRIDFREGYDQGLADLLRNLNVATPTPTPVPQPSVPHSSQPHRDEWVPAEAAKAEAQQAAEAEAQRLRDQQAAEARAAEQARHQAELEAQAAEAKRLKELNEKLAAENLRLEEQAAAEAAKAKRRQEVDSLNDEDELSWTADETAADDLEFDDSEPLMPQGATEEEEQVPDEAGQPRSIKMFDRLPPSAKVILSLVAWVLILIIVVPVAFVAFEAAINLWSHSST